MIAWYLAPYDTERRARGISRVPAMARHIPTVPNADGADWEETEILGNHILVKVSAPDALHTRIGADNDFLSINAASTPTIHAKLLALGYAQAELDTVAPWTLTNLLEMLANSGRSRFALNAARDGLQQLPGRQAQSKSLSDIDQRIR